MKVSKSFKISNSEMEVMKLLWESDSSMTSKELRTILKSKIGWEKSTVLTLIKRLVEKGIISYNKNDVFYYYPNITKEQYKQLNTQTLIDKLFEGNIKNLIMSLCDETKLSENDLQELRDYFNKGIKKNE